MIVRHIHDDDDDDDDDDCLSADSMKRMVVVCILHYDPKHVRANWRGG